MTSEELSTVVGNRRHRPLSSRMWCDRVEERYLVTQLTISFRQFQACLVSLIGTACLPPKAPHRSAGGLRAASNAGATLGVRHRLRRRGRPVWVETGGDPLEAQYTPFGLLAHILRRWLDLPGFISDLLLDSTKTGGVRFFVLFQRNGIWAPDSVFVFLSGFCQNLVLMEMAILSLSCAGPWARCHCHPLGMFHEVQDVNRSPGLD